MLLLAGRSWFINYLNKILSHEFLRIQDGLSIGKQLNGTLVNGMDIR